MPGEFLTSRPFLIRFLYASNLPFFFYQFEIEYLIDTSIVVPVPKYDISLLIDQLLLPVH